MWALEKAAPFPEPEEELYGAAANGKMYVQGGFGPGGHPVGMMWEYDPAADKWTKKKSMPVPAHHAAITEYHGKLYIFGGFTFYAVPNQTFGGWEPIDNAWEYDPAADSWKALAPLPTKRGSPVAVTQGGKIYVIGGASNQGSNAPAIFPTGPARSLTVNEAYDPETNKWETRNPMPTPRNHAYAGAVSGKIYVIGGRVAQPFITVASNLDIVEEYDPLHRSVGSAEGSHAYCAQWRRFCYLQRPYLCGGWRGSDSPTAGSVQSPGDLRSRNESVGYASSYAASTARSCYCLPRQSLALGKRENHFRRIHAGRTGRYG